MTKYISVGKIINFHGIHGEARVGYYKNQQDFFLSLTSVYVKNNNEYMPLDIVSVRQNKNFLIVKFKGIDSINDIIPYKGDLLFVEESVIRETLDEDEFLIDELVGLNVFDVDTGKKLGFVVGVSKNVSLIPFVKAIVPVVDIQNKKILINNIEGLLE